MSTNHTPGPKTSYLVAATGVTRGLLAQVFARDEGKACAAVNAAALDFCGEAMECLVIDTEATPGLWFEGDPAYIRAVILKATEALAKLHDGEGAVRYHERAAVLAKATWSN